jgi:hypothetical protein
MPFLILLGSGHDFAVVIHLVAVGHLVGSPEVAAVAGAVAPALPRTKVQRGHKQFRVLQVLSQ